MMPDLFVGWHLLVLGLSFAGFVLLALASEREGRVLLRRAATPREKAVCRLLGWPLLTLALGVCVWGWFGHFGTVLWFGWLTVAAMVVVFAVAYWPWRQQTNRRFEAEVEAVSVRPPAIPGMSVRRWRALWVVLLVALPMGLGWRLHQAPLHPLLHPGAVRGHVGPWSFVIAEASQEAPEISSSIGAPIKYFMLRFCEGCDAQIRAAYLRVNKPRSPRAAGIVFGGPHWERRVDIQLPANTTAGSELWLTVEGKDGLAHQTSIRMDEVSPATVAWFARRERSR